MMTLMIPGNWKSRTLWLVALSAPALMAPVAYSQVLEEVVVTAQKREQNLQDVSVSVSALSGSQIKNMGLTDTTEITQQIPSLQINAWSPNLTIFNLRGISQNNFTDNLEGPVAVYLDDAYVGSLNAVSGQLFDVERIEVLRGPQGTLFGRNATGGLIHYISRGADESEFNGYVEAGFGSFDRRSLEFAAGGAINDAETVRGRVAGRWEEADGYIESAAALPGVFDGNGQDLGGADGFGLRGTLQIDFNDVLTGELIVKYNKDDNVPTGGYVLENCEFEANGYCRVNEAGLGIAAPGVINGITGERAGVHDNFADTRGFLNRDATNVTARFDWGLSDSVTLTSITNHLSMDKDYAEDADALPVVVLNFANDVDYSQFSQELRIAGTNERMHWQAGFYYLDFEIDGGALVQGAPIIGTALAINGSPDDPASVWDYLLNSRNISVFGQIDFHLSDSVSLTTGLRYSQDDKDNVFDVTLTQPGFADASIVDSRAFPEDTGEIDYGDYAFRIGVDWRATESTLIYGSINRGIKGGNWTLSDTVTAENFQHDEEVLLSYEAGLKTQSAEGRVRFNAGAFYYDYDDYQAFAIFGGAPQVNNSDASSYGAELELFMRPTDNWDIMLGAAFLSSEVDRVFTAGEQFGPDFTGGAVLSAGDCVNVGDAFFCDYPADSVTNTEFPNAPSISLNYLARYNWPLASGSNIAVQIDGVWHDDQFLEVTNSTASAQEAYGITNARVSYSSPDDRFSLIVWGKNLTDEEYKAYSLDLGILGTTSYYGPPSTYGITARYNW